MKLYQNRTFRFISCCAVILALIIVLMKIYASLLIPLGISFFLTYLLTPLVKKLQKYRIPRGASAFFLLLFTLGIITITFLHVLPYLYFETLNLIKKAPSVFDSFMNTWIPEIKERLISDLIDEETLNYYISEMRDMVHISDRIEQALTTIWQTAPMVLGTVINMLLIPLLTFFLIKDWEDVKQQLVRLVPVDLRSPLAKVENNLDLTLRAVIKGQVTVAIILSVLYIIGLNVAGIQAATAIGLVAGVCRLIPYLDVIVGLPLSIIAILSNFHSFGQIVFVFSVFLFVQTLDGMLITPRMIGEKVGLHPAIVIVSVIAFSNIMGFWGVLLAIPIVAALKTLWLLAEPVYLKSTLYKQTHKKD